MSASPHRFVTTGTGLERIRDIHPSQSVLQPPQIDGGVWDRAGLTVPTMRHRPMGLPGFALVIALALMAFIFLLLASLTSLLQVEINHHDKEKALQGARENARFALLEALGELQSLAGPDTRATARAEILSTTGDAGFDSAAFARLWTGVWDSTDWDPGDSSERQNRFLGWLTSFEPADRSNFNLAHERPAGRYVTLAQLRFTDEHSGDPAEVVEVDAWLRETGGDGGYAWWISDEGVKAHLALDDPFAGTRQGDLAEDIGRFAFPHRPALDATYQFEAADFADQDFLQSLQRSLDIGALRIAFEDQPEALRAAVEGSLLTDFTLYSTGVLSDQRRGGLKRDLSLALWRDPAEWRALATGANYTVNTGFENDFRTHRVFNEEDYLGQGIRSASAAGRSFIGPRWSILRDFHNAWQKLDDPGQVNPSLKLDVGGMGQSLFDVPRSDSPASWGAPGSRGRIELPDNPFAGATDPLHLAGSAVSAGARMPGYYEMTNSGLYPLMIRGTVFFTLDAIEVPGEGGDPSRYAPRVNAYAIVHMWNPYNITLTSLDPVTGLSAGSWRMNVFPDVRFTLSRYSGDSLLGQWSFNYHQLRNAEIHASNPGGVPTTDRTQFNLEPGAGRFEFRPGEIRAFTLRSATTGDIVAGVTAGVLRPYFTDPQVAIPYSYTGPPVPWKEGASRTTDAVLFDHDDVLEVEFSLANNLTIPGSEPAFRMGSSGANSHNASLTQEFGAIWIVGATSFTETIDNIPDLVGFPIELGGIEVRMKPADAADGPDRILANFNPRAVYIGTQMGAAANHQPPNWSINFIQGDPFATIAWDPEPRGSETLLRGFWGPTDQYGGVTFASLFDVPRRPPESLGHYQHAHLSIYPHQPAYALGNSLADPHVDPRYAVDVRDGKTQMDLSWLLNDAIWDGYFLSTLEPEGSIPAHPRFIAIDPDLEFTPADHAEVAENILLRGAFNINSTSVEAWAAMLASLGGDGVRFFDTLGAANATTADLENPFFRLSVPAGDTNTAWLGGARDLNRNEIRSLAEEMVNQVKLRGPFLSLSDFVNRRLESGPRGEKGAIQAAIDNAGLATTGSSAPGGSGDQAMFAPGWLSQADILTALGPVLAARSDTFIIRAYGETRNPLTDEITATAWCEALVQRTPELLFNTLASPASATHSRRFQITAFRWLTENDL